jgi:hypothetical protein
VIRSVTDQRSARPNAAQFRRRRLAAHRFRACGGRCRAGGARAEPPSNGSPKPSNTADRCSADRGSEHGRALPIALQAFGGAMSVASLYARTDWVSVRDDRSLANPLKRSWVNVRQDRRRRSRGARYSRTTWGRRACA